MRILTLVVAFFAPLVCAGTSRAINFTPGHLYTTWDRTITEFDANGARLGSLSLPGSQIWSGAFGRDGLFYVTRWNGTVDAIRADGSIVRQYTFPGLAGPALLQASIAFDPTGENFYVTVPGATIYKFNVNSAAGSPFGQGFWGLATLPNGEVLTSNGYNLVRYSSSGEFLGGIGDDILPGYLTDPHDVTPDPDPMLADVRGIAYDPALDRTFIFQMGYGGGAGDYYYQLYALNGVTNELVDVTRFEIGYNLALGQNGQLLVGGGRSSPGILDAATLDLVTRLSGIPAVDQQLLYIAMMPVPEPSRAAGVFALLALLALRLGRSA